MYMNKIHAYFSKKKKTATNKQTNCSFYDSKTSINSLNSISLHQQNKNIGSCLWSFLHTACLSQNSKYLLFPSFPPHSPHIYWSKAELMLSLKYWTFSVFLTSMPNFKGMTLGTQQLLAVLPEDSSVPGTDTDCSLPPITSAPRLLCCLLTSTGTSTHVANPDTGTQIEL